MLVRARDAARVLGYPYGIPDKIGYACRLLRKAYRSGASVVVTADDATLKTLDKQLWRGKATWTHSATGGAEFEWYNNVPMFRYNAYFGIHTFRFINRDNRTTPVRWRFVPQDGEKRPSAEELAALPADFLEPRLIERMRQGPVRWDMVLTIGAPGDPENDPTVAWPESREQVKVGTLTLTSATPQKGAACEKINFDPLVMSDGIAPSDDPVLRFRSQAYAASFAKRIGGQ